MLKNTCRLIVSTVFFFASLAMAAETAKPQVPAQQVPAQQVTTNPQVVLMTSMGEMTVELFPEKAPETVKNFLKYVDNGFYDGVIFHRIIANFMVQTGGFDKNYYKKATSAPIINESNNGLKNERGTLSMARTGDPHSATAQFFINLVNNSSLDFQPGRLGMPDQFGYAVFGKVIKGIEAIDKMAAQPQGMNANRGHGEFVNAPNDQITIDRAFRVAEKAPKAKADK